MQSFTASDLKALDTLWRNLPPDHVWTGWSACGECPEEIILYRTQAHWRQFPLRKTEAGFSVYDDQGIEVAKATSLGDLIKEVEAIPGLIRND